MKFRHGPRLGIVSAVLFAAVLAAQAPVPETAATRQLARWLVTFNAGDRGTWQRFLSEFASPEPPAYVDQNLAFRDQTGGFDLIAIEESAPTRVVALVKERDAEAVAARITLEIEAADAHRIVSVDVQPGLRLPVSVKRLSEVQLVKAFQDEINKRAAADRFAGAVLVAKNQKPILVRAYGLADRARHVPNRIDTRFRNGSMGKMFTAVAVLTLVQAGKVSLVDPIGKYLTDYPNKTLASKVTVHQLLTHTAGTGDVFGPEFAARRLELRTHEDYVKMYGERDLMFEPGSRWMYSNYGYILLGAIIERVSGQNYYDYVRDHVYKPAGMRATGSEPEDQPAANRSIGYTKRPGTSAWIPNSETLPYRGTAAGGGYTTVGDLLRFADALTNHQLLTAQYTDLLTAGKVDGVGGRYAYGFVARVEGGIRSFGHGGNAPGMDGYLEIFPDSGYVVAVLANMDPPAAQRIIEFILNRLPG